MSSYVQAATPTCVFVVMDDRAEFDKIALEPTAHPAQPDGSVCTTKSIWDSEKVAVVFQCWSKPVPGAAA